MRNVFVRAPSGLTMGILLAAGLAWPIAASAEVVKVAGNGFTVRETADIAAPRRKSMRH